MLRKYYAPVRKIGGFCKIYGHFLADLFDRQFFKRYVNFFLPHEKALTACHHTRVCISLQTDGSVEANNINIVTGLLVVV